VTRTCLVQFPTRSEHSLRAAEEQKERRGAARLRHEACYCGLTHSKSANDTFPRSTAVLAPAFVRQRRRELLPSDAIVDGSSDVYSSARQCQSDMG
jgi:hypothetical protein